MEIVLNTRGRLEYTFARRGDRTDSTECLSIKYHITYRRLKQRESMCLRRQLFVVAYKTWMSIEILPRKKDGWEQKWQIIKIPRGAAGVAAADCFTTKFKVAVKQMSVGRQRKCRRWCSNEYTHDNRRAGEQHDVTRTEARLYIEKFKKRNGQHINYIQSYQHMCVLYRYPHL